MFPNEATAHAQNCNSAFKASKMVGTKLSFHNLAYWKLGYGLIMTYFVGLLSMKSLRQKLREQTRVMSEHLQTNMWNIWTYAFIIGTRVFHFRRWIHGRMWWERKNNACIYSCTTWTIILLLMHAPWETISSVKQFPRPQANKLTVVLLLHIYLVFLLTIQNFDLLVVNALSFTF